MTEPLEPLTTAELDARLEAQLNPVLSSRRTAAPLAAALAPIARELQDYALHWTAIISRTNTELAYQFATAVPAALLAMDTPAAEAWIIEAMDTYDRAGLHQGTLVLQNFPAFAARQRVSHTVQFAEVAPVLEKFICGLSGRHLKIDSAAVPWTDTETLYLPPRISAGVDRAQNFLIYKIIATLLWAQTRFGTFNADLQLITQSYAEDQHALAWLNFLESLRLEAQISTLLPGLARDLAALSDYEAHDDPRYAPLRMPQASVADSIALLAAVDLSAQPPQCAWSGALHPDAASRTRAARMAREKSALQSALAALLDDADQTADDPAPEDAKARDEFGLNSETGANGEVEFELTLGGKPMPPPRRVRELLQSILQDIDELPDDYFNPRTQPDAAQSVDAADATRTAVDDAASLSYDEWDFQRRHYRKNWCVLRELDAPTGDDHFVPATLKKYAVQVAHLRRSFEMLRGEDRLLKRMQHGDDIDLDAVISGYAEMKCGMELSERLFTKRHKAERNLAVLFMVDMSGSTKGWINEAEREALVLLAEALEVLGDRYAIYGFSGMTRKQCEIFRIKRFDEPYSTLVQQRIAGIAPQDYTRMGVAIRHLTALFETVDARTKLLITLSDGKPDDYSDNYRGDYGIEDTRQALLEAHRAGIKPFCITIDHQARDYLPHMYGAVNWTMVDDVSRLPFKVADIYRRLTT